jgi:hypothetical protein
VIGVRLVVSEIFFEQGRLADMHHRIGLGHTVHDVIDPGVGLISLQSVVPTSDLVETEDTAGPCHRHVQIGGCVDETIAIGVVRLLIFEIVGQALTTVPQDVGAYLQNIVIGGATVSSDVDVYLPNIAIGGATVS